MPYSYLIQMTHIENEKGKVYIIAYKEAFVIQACDKNLVF